MIFGKVLLPTDFRTGYEEAFAKLKGMRIQADEVVLLHVVDDRMLESFMREHEISSTARAEEILRDMVERKLWVEAARASRIFKTDDVRTIVTFGSPEREIVKGAEREDASVVVMPSRGDVFTSHSLGSTTIKVISLSQTPVLVVGVGHGRDES